MKVDHTPGFLIWHVPHDGWEFPEELMSSVCIPMEKFKAYHEKMRDAGVAGLIPEVHGFQTETVQTYKLYYSTILLGMEEKNTRTCRDAANDLVPAVFR